MSCAVPRAPHPGLTASHGDTALAWLRGDRNVSLDALKELVKTQTQTQTPFYVAKGPQMQQPQSWLLFGCLWGKKVTLPVSQLVLHCLSCTKVRAWAAFLHSFSYEVSFKNKNPLLSIWQLLRVLNLLHIKVCVGGKGGGGTVGADPVLCCAVTLMAISPCLGGMCVPV